MNCKSIFSLVASGCLLTQLFPAFAQGTALTYQGRLNLSGNPASGNFDLGFYVASAASGNNAVSDILTNTATPVSNGHFTVTLDFGPGIFTGAERWLAIAVRTNGGGAFTPLSPRQLLTATPYAVTASNLSGTISAAQVSGALAATQLPANVLTNNSTGVQLAGTFAGTGSGLTNLNASNLAGGTVPDARLSANVSLLGANIDSSEIANGTIVNADIASGAAIDDAKLATINTAGKVANAATTATSANTGHSIVARDASGNFSAGTISGTFSGNGAGLTNLSITAMAPSQTLVFMTNTTSTFGFLPSAAYPTDSPPPSLASADMNNDGRMDIIALSSATFVVFTNSLGGVLNRAGTYPYESFNNAVCTADVNNDGRKDVLISGGSSTGKVGVWTNAGNASLVFSGEYVAGRFPSGIATGDFNNDGWVDVAYPNRGYDPYTNTISVFTNTGTGQFATSATLVGGYAPEGIVCTELNGDGWQDLIVAGQTNQGYVFFGTGGGNFTLSNHRIEAMSEEMVVGDFNNDGKMDLAAASGRVHYGGEIDWITIYLNNGFGTLTSNSIALLPEEGALFRGVCASDFNGDGKMDIAATHSWVSEIVLVWTNSVNGFSLATTNETGTSPAAVIAADLNGDGSPDLINGHIIDPTFSVFFNSMIATTVTSTFQGSFTGSTLNVLGNATVNGMSIISQTAVTVTNNATLTPASGYVKLSASSAVTLNTTNAIANGPAIGAMLILEGSSDVNTVTVPHAANTRLSAAHTLGIRDMLTLIWNGNNWLEVSYSDND
ncbi:MAG: VCBS repeat-containing protein [Verrucomicrobiota bacterium]